MDAGNRDGWLLVTLDRWLLNSCIMKEQSSVQHLIGPSGFEQLIVLHKQMIYNGEHAVCFQAKYISLEAFQYKESLKISLNSCDKSIYAHALMSLTYHFCLSKSDKFYSKNISTPL